MLFYTQAGGSNDERMRIDSSGNLLVGTTTTAVANGTTAGIAATSGDQLLVGTSSDVSAAFNRITDDGDIVLFAKTFHNQSIGSEGGDSHILSGDAGLRFSGGADTILPCTTAGAVRDGISLGMSSARFEDLYLSG